MFHVPQGKKLQPTDGSERIVQLVIQHDVLSISVCTISIQSFYFSKQSSCKKIHAQQYVLFSPAT